MAQRVIKTLVDDVDGSEASETVIFALDGRTYEIDLNDENAKKLRKSLEAFVTAGRKTGGSRTTTRRSAGGSKAPTGGGDTALIRSWAKNNGYEINDRGRVPATIREAYDKATA
ncbi:histone-like nucleoid-structuring protein Lsr2 [Streptomyces aureocirculatus]|uniref:histone-like nucleoid-structuring protein Lsr2 n=1 Tax=Streptomyces aureocirculatus TaxID=67275 RepID=UPI0004CAFEBD|nr:Lsr2 family protein [Streptomyces aureocirculatus]